MGTVKPWQIVVMVLAVVAVVGSAFYSCKGSSDTKVTQANSVTLVDIKSGALFEAQFPDKRPVSWPAKNPDSGDLTLYPAYQKDNSWYVLGRVLRDVRRDKNLNKQLMADEKSGQLKLENQTPKAADVFGK